MKIVPASDSSLLVVFGDEISPAIQWQVHALFHGLRASQDARIRNLHLGYASLLVDFDPLAMSHEDLSALISVIDLSLPSQVESECRTVEIPVCYDPEFGPDQENVAAHTGLPVADVVRLHAEATYTAAFLGFTGGFAYLSGLPSVLSTPRLATPRRAVAAGSVGIAGAQTAVYPTVTPGGWRLIGRTPLLMFEPARAQPSLVVPGDRVKFLPISRSEFEALYQERA